MKVGSLFSGAGGLDLAVQWLWPDADLAWFAETDVHAAAVFAHHHDAPNLGDLRKVEWGGVEPVDVMVGGYPCQPWSNAGKRQGVDDDRDGWPWFREAVGALGPAVVLLENVRGHVVPAGAGRTVGDLSDLGYDAVWSTIRASDVGCCHRRERWFSVAYTSSEGPLGRAGDGDTEPTSRPHGRQPAQGASPTHAPKVTLPTPIVSDANADSPGVVGFPQLRAIDRLTPAGGWGRYADAIARWEAIHGPAPQPTDDKGRLSPPFVEWMMGWPDGWTAVEGASRAQRLKMLGNGVVPHQAYAAYSGLLERAARQEVAA